MKYSPIIVLMFLLFVPISAFGVEVYVDESISTFKQGESQFSVRINTGNESINALSGTLSVPDNVTVTRVYTGGSAILIWSEKPKLENTIIFSGITPGGLQGDYELFSVAYQASSSINATVHVKDLEIYKNDGSGPIEVVKNTPFKIYIKETATSSVISKDIYPPEPFIIFLDKDKNSFDGNYFASFMTQDKQTGVSGYRVATSWFFKPNTNSWQDTEHPYIFKNLDVFKNIYIQAVDVEGNTQVANVSGPYRYTFRILGSIILVILCVLFYARRRY